MPRQYAKLLALATVFSSSLLAQGLNTQASKDDWEEINFEFGSAVLSDGYPSLLRLADLLQKNTGYHVKVEGNTDNIGSERSNEKLGLARANTVRDFLVKYGANAGQIDVTTRGKRDPKYPGYKNRYSHTDVPRWMNRRVVLTVTDQNGKTVSDGGVGQAIQAIAPAPPQNPPCCDDILKRLDQITALLNDMKNQNADLRRQLDDVKNQQAALENKVNNLPKPLTEAQTSQVVDARLEKARDPRFSLLGLNIGADDRKNVTFTGSGRFFAPFKEHFAVQIQGEYLYFRNQKEGQGDIGLVNRIGRFQGGLFASFKNVDLSNGDVGQFQGIPGYSSTTPNSGLGHGNGTLGQGALVLDYIFSRGKVGLFGTKAFLDNATLNTANYTFQDASGNTVIAPNIFLQQYLHVVDQIGVQGTVGLWGNSYLEANIGYLKSVAHADRPGGTVRFVFPFRSRLAFTVEGGVNETLLRAGNSGRAVVGVEFGNLLRPKEFASVDHPIPMQVPRVRYEVAVRRIQRGVSPPVADAGPDQLGIPAGNVTLNGTGSHDPNGEALTYQWIQEGGPTAAISNANQATASFTAAAGQGYTFRLTVRNTDGQTASARTRVTTTSAPQVNILYFIANPTSINAGQTSQLTWSVQN
ncbi:MAG: OmpA family protein, partial [Acidobacteriaceae bacterium]|nr:OmpA family protein [Acidobacteriaceae bacterium]